MMEKEEPQDKEKYRWLTSISVQLPPRGQNGAGKDSQAFL